MTGAATPFIAIERRAFPEIRALANQRRLEGYAATFGSEARLGDIVETIEPGAFRAALNGDILALAERSDLGGMSFGFIVPRGGDSWTGNRRSLRAVDLREISVVSAFPAYPDTSIALRSRDAATGMGARRRAITIAEMQSCA